ncbi:MAG: SDR family oxidoreductase [Erythrobacter sp.]
MGVDCASYRTIQLTTRDFARDLALSKRVAISAGASGIGRAIAEAYLAVGDTVYVSDIDEAALASLSDAHPRAVAFNADAGEPDQVGEFFMRIARDEPLLDVLVNNAGIAGPTARLEDIAVTDWVRTINIDLNSAFYFAREAIPMLRRSGGGSIINIASNAAFFGFPMRSPYASSKWGIIGLTKTLAMELGPEGIRVNAVCPGSVEGPRIDRVIAEDARQRGLDPAEVEAEYKSQSSLRTFVSAQEVVSLVTYLTSDVGRRISGQAIGLDGHTEGLSLKFGN